MVKYTIVCKTETYSKASNTDKVLFVLYDNPKIEKKALSLLMLPVTSVTSVTYISIFGNKSNKGNKISIQEREDFNNILKNYLYRHKENDFVFMDASVSPPVYYLSEKGEEKVNSLWKFLNQLDERIKVLENEK